MHERDEAARALDAHVDEQQRVQVVKVVAHARPNERQYAHVDEERAHVDRQDIVQLIAELVREAALDARPRIAVHHPDVVGDRVRHRRLGLFLLVHYGRSAASCRVVAVLCCSCCCCCDRWRRLSGHDFARDLLASATQIAPLARGGVARARHQRDVPEACLVEVLYLEGELIAGDDVLLVVLVEAQAARWTRHAAYEVLRVVLGALEEERRLLDRLEHHGTRGRARHDQSILVVVDEVVVVHDGEHHERVAR